MHRWDRDYSLGTGDASNRPTSPTAAKTRGLVGILFNLLRRAEQSAQSNTPTQLVSKTTATTPSFPGYNPIAGTGPDYCKLFTILVSF